MANEDFFQQLKAQHGANGPRPLHCFAKLYWQAQAAMTTMAKVLAGYWKALRQEGFSRRDALNLTLGVQRSLLDPARQYGSGMWEGPSGE